MFCFIIHTTDYCLSSWLIKYANTIDVFILDSKLVNSVGDSKTNVFITDPVVGGFNFTQLKSLYPDLINDLYEFHGHLIANDNELRPLKVWQFRELAMQVSQSIMDAFRMGKMEEAFANGAKTNLGLLKLRELSQNLPSHAR